VGGAARDRDRRRRRRAASARRLLAVLFPRYAAIVSMTRDTGGHRHIHERCSALSFRNAQKSKATERQARRNRCTFASHRRAPLRLPARLTRRCRCARCLRALPQMVRNRLGPAPHLDLLRSSAAAPRVAQLPRLADWMGRRRSQPSRLVRGRRDRRIPGRPRHRQPRGGRCGSGLGRRHARRGGYEFDPDDIVICRPSDQVSEQFEHPCFLARQWFCRAGRTRRLLGRQRAEGAQ
jgi:hypothetical protein